MLSLLLHLVSRPRPALVATAAGLLAAAVAALASGPLVAWRELAIWGAAVEAGRTSFSGHLWLLGGDVRFVVVNSNELEPSTMAALLGVHLGAAAVTAAMAIGMVILQGRPPTSSGAPRPSRP